MELVKNIRNSLFIQKRLLYLLLFFGFLAINFNLTISLGGINYSKCTVTNEECLLSKISDSSFVLHAHAGERLQDAADDETNKADVPWYNVFVRGINWVLYYVFLFLSMLLGIAGFIFDWVIDPQNIQNVLDRPAIYDMWKVVRDFLNLMFILVLLYSAFCTVFQIEKYHLKKILLTLVLMALLVNFSFPVSRFIIDTSNVTGYFFLNTVFSGADKIESKSARFVALTKIADILVPREGSKGNFNSKAPTSQILAAIIFIFILMITLMVIALMFVIRLVVLAILIIFSPVGFVAAAFPSTKHYADDWWKNLFKYALFFPIMVFMLAIAFRLMSELGLEESGAAYKEMLGQAQNYSGGDDPSSIANMAFFSIPIIMLWVGLMTAQKMGIAGADVITNKAKGAANWAMRQPWRGTKRLVGTTGIPGGMKRAAEYYGKKGFGIPFTKRRVFGSDKREGLEARRAEQFGVKGAASEHNRKKVAQIRDDWRKQGGISEEDALKNMDKKNPISLRQAAALELADKHGFKGENAYGNYKKAKSLMEGDLSLDKSLDDFTKKKRIDLVISHKTSGKKGEELDKELGKELGKLSASDFGKMDFKDFFTNSGKSAEDATKNYFSGSGSARKTEISKNLNKLNEAILEERNLLFETKRKSGLTDQHGRPV